MSKKKEMEVLSANTRHLREERGWSRATLALRCGYSENWLANVEQGESLLSLTGLFALAKALGVEPYDLLMDTRKIKNHDDILKVVSKFIKQFDLSKDQVIRWLKIGRMLFASDDGDKRSKK